MINTNMLRRAGIVILTAGMLTGCKQDHGSVEQAAQRVDSLQVSVDRMEHEIGRLRERMTTGSFNIWYRPELDGRALSRQGIDSTEAFIRRQLQDRPELIPLDPVLGGTMHFVKVQVLGRQWVIAQYEDGHIAGRAIYRYTLTPEGGLEFELLDSSRL